MPKVLRIINRFNLGGPSFNAAYLTRYLSPEYETLLVGGVKEKEEESSEFIMQDLGIDLIIIPEMKRSINPFDDFAAYRKIKKIISEFKPDIVHTHAAKAGTIGRLAAVRSNVEIVVHTFHGHVFHSYFNKFRSLAYREIERYLAKYTHSIIALSESQKVDLSLKFGICRPEKISIIPLGFDLTRFVENQDEKRRNFRNRYKLSDREIAVGIIGRLTRIKNHGMFLNIMSKIKGRTENHVTGFIIGDGELRIKLMKMAGESNLTYSEREAGDGCDLVFTSWIKNNAEIFAGLDIIVMTSLNEGTPVSLIEAQAAGKPVIATRAGGTTDIVRGDMAGYLTDIDDVEGFAARLSELIDNDVLRKKMGYEGRQFALKSFHYTRLANDMSTHYETLIRNKQVF